MLSSQGNLLNEVFKGMHNKRYVRFLLPAIHSSPSKDLSWFWFLWLEAQQSKARGIFKKNMLRELMNGITAGY